MNVIWFSLFNRGYTKNMTLQEAKRNRLMNRLIFICLGIFIPYYILGVINSNSYVLIEFTIITFIFFIIYIKNRRGHHPIAKTIFILALLYLVADGLFNYGDKYLVWVILLSTPVLSFMIFSEEDYIYIFLINLFAFSLFLFSLFLKDFIKPTYNFEPGMEIIYSVLNLVTSYLIISVCIYYFFEANNEMEVLLESEKDKSDKLLLNILPKEIAEELKVKGTAEPVYFENVTVMFTDFKGFTQIAESLSPQELINELDYCFSAFDSIINKYKIEKLKTIGDAYMCAAGIPTYFDNHAKNTVLAAFEILEFMNSRKEDAIKKKQSYWDIRIGIHSGHLVAGVIGKNKFAYDIWGDTVNIASRMESSGESGKINISKSTYELIKDDFNFEYRGKIQAKNKGDVEMYFVSEKK